MIAESRIVGMISCKSVERVPAFVSIVDQQRSRELVVLCFYGFKTGSCLLVWRVMEISDDFAHPSRLEAA